MRLLDVLRGDPLLARLSGIVLILAPERTAATLVYAEAGPDALPDRTVAVDTADILGQVEEVRASGLVGGISVERWGAYLLVSLHAATGDARDAWLSELKRHAEPAPENVTPICRGRKGARQ